MEKLLVPKKLTLNPGDVQESSHEILVNLASESTEPLTSWEHRDSNGKAAYF